MTGARTPSLTSAGKGWRGPVSAGPERTCPGRGPCGSGLAGITLGRGEDPADDIGGWTGAGLGWPITGGRMGCAGSTRGPSLGSAEAPAGSGCASMEGGAEAGATGVAGGASTTGSVTSASARASAREAPLLPTGATPKCRRNLSATSSSIELECVNFSVTPNSGSISRMVCDFTSSSRARTLIRILLIKNQSVYCKLPFPREQLSCKQSTGYRF